MLCWAERVWPPSGSERSGDGRARRSQTARAWPRAAQHKLVACLNRAVISKSTLKIIFPAQQTVIRTDGRVVEGTGLENRHTVLPYRGFESLSVRQIAISALLKPAINLCCAARGHALAIWLRLALLSALLLATLGDQTRSAPRNNPLTPHHLPYLVLLGFGADVDISVLFKGSIFNSTVDCKC